MSAKLLNSLKAKQPSIEKRISAGKALREKYPRSAIAEFKPSTNRIDPISILEEQAKTRLPDLVPVRYARMLTSPFAFLRGSAAVMASDLASSSPTTKLSVQTCGDMHLANFGVFASAERNLVFGINDFDETLPGPWEWDLKRLVASIVVCGRFLEASKALCQEAVMSTVSSYREKMKQYAYMGNLELWYSNIKTKDILKVISPSARKGAEKLFRKARHNTHTQVLGKLTDLVDDKYLLRENTPFIVKPSHTQSGTPLKEALGILLESYCNSLADDRKSLLKRYRIVDVARKVVGVGSVGTRCWILLLKGNHSEDPLFLQVKEAQQSVLEPFVAKSVYSNNGQRVVAGQRLIQGAPDIFLGWGENEGFQFYIRQLRDMKGGVEFDPKKVKVENLPQYGSLCAWASALAHAKSGDAASIAGYVGNSDELDIAMVCFAEAYADQTENDFEALKSAAKSGRIKVSDAN
ncbi:MAG: DUF2252 domain-containing protein [Lentisphaerota bacterium]